MILKKYLSTWTEIFDNVLYITMFIDLLNVIRTSDSDT